MAATPPQKLGLPAIVDLDIERCAHDTSYLRNSVVHNLAWSGVTVTVPDRDTKQPKEILSNVSGCVVAGEMMAIMGPSGCGKTTLLMFLRSGKPLRKHTSPMSFYSTAKLYLTQPFGDSHPQLSLSVTAVERMRRIDELLQAFGLTNQANTLIGTLLKKGISTGQKRRLSVASQLIAAPKILFLDEPTTGLDSAASFKVISYVRQVAKANNLIVIASIHQPSTATFELFDTLLLPSGGKVCFSGSVPEVKPYFDSIGFVMPPQINPAEFILDLTNMDFDSDVLACQERIEQIQNSWISSPAGLTEKSRRRSVNSGGGSFTDIDN